jgi:TRAP-type mannitol/chloroaromatic compound transport system permease small subunit
LIKVSSFIDLVNEYFARVSAFLLVLLVGLIVYDVVNRYLFSSGSIAIQEFQWHLFDIIFLLGLSYTHRLNENVRVDIFYANFSPKIKVLVDVFTNIFIIIPFVLIVIYVSFGFIEMSIAQSENSSDPGGLCCRYYIKSFIVVGFFMLFLQSISEAIKSYHRV